jgi:phosphate transport system substrate-binding protein
VAAIALALSGCQDDSAAGANQIRIKGSDTLVGLGQRWCEAYIALHPDVFVSVTGGGSGTGIAALEEGTCDVAQASREIKPAEEKKIAAVLGSNPIEYIVAWDGIAVIVNPYNPVQRVTLEQLSDMYTGKITNWRDLGGADAQIVLLARETSSGTYAFFKKTVLQLGGKRKDADYTDRAILSTSNVTIHNEVAANPNAVGYVGLAFVDGKVRPLAVGKDAKGPFLQPHPDNILAKTYPIARPLYNYLPRRPSGVLKGYMDFVLGHEGQALVREMGFVPVPKRAPSREQSGAHHGK